jgi:SAM-dependent methyltransferase
MRAVRVPPASVAAPAKPELPVHEIRSLEGYQQHCRDLGTEHARRWQLELSLLGKSDPIATPGYCHVCAQDRLFSTDFLYSSHVTKTGQKIPNWRERVICPGCGLNNRMRGAIHLLEQYCRANPSSAIFATEQVTPLFAALAKRFPNAVGSEYLGDKIAFGETSLTGVRNESITRLTFADRQFDYMLCFDVLEHVPEYARAIAECSRCLKDDGTLLLSVPFLSGQYENRVRARLTGKGDVEHLLPAEYHGDPIKDAGCLSFYDFGWELLDELKRAGFADASMALFWSDQFGYYGVEQMIIIARKSAPVH